MGKAADHLLLAESFASKAYEESVLLSQQPRAQTLAQLAAAHAQIAIAYKTITG